MCVCVCLRHPVKKSAVHFTSTSDSFLPPSDFPICRTDINIVHTTKRKKVSLIILCRNCLIEDFTEGKIKGRVEVTGRPEGRRKQLDLKEKTEYCKLKYEAPDSTVWRTLFVRGYEPVLGRVYIGIVNGLVTCTTNLQDSY